MAKSKTVQQIRPRRRSSSDPFEAVLLPPPNETPEQREQRLNAEYAAKLVSDNIDQMIANERNAKKRAKAEIKVLLLGQSESGKSTTLKQFQLMHTPAAFHAERIAWRAVIYLNLVRSIRRILDAISPELDADDRYPEDDACDSASVSAGLSSSGTKVAKFEFYRRNLEPLLELEARLTRLLSSPNEDEPIRLGPTPESWRSGYYGSGRNGRPTPTLTIPSPSVKSASLPASPQTASTSSSQIPFTSSLFSTSKDKEVAVHTTTNWKKAFSLGGKAKSPKSANSGEIAGWWEDPDDPAHTLNALAQNMVDLWRDRQVRRKLKEKQLRLEESSGFYLDEIPRIAALKYIPTDLDVLKARLKTLGIVEHTFTIPNGNYRGVDWKIYDVGGSRNQRQAWAPYFEDVNAIIFLAPISAFDQVLAEDLRVNRLEDTLILWKSVISNKLLAEVNIILFLNKCDLLQAKLDAGVRLRNFMVSYGDRPNDYDSVSKYFRNKFGALHQSYTPNKERELFIHLTAVTDTRRTSTIISNVRDIIIKDNLKALKMM